MLLIKLEQMRQLEEAGVKLADEDAVLAAAMKLGLGAIEDDVVHKRYKQTLVDYLAIKADAEGRQTSLF